MNNQMALIEKLSGRDNFATWRFAMQTYLQHEELWDCIEDEVKDTKRDIKAKTKIILSVDPINYVHIQEAKTAKEVWHKLTSAFDDSGLTRRVGLLRDLCNTSLAGCQNVEEYVSKIINTAYKLRNIGFKVDDEWLGTLLLSGLPESYQPMIIAIESSGMKISSDSVKAKLLQDVRPPENDSKAFAVTKKFHKNSKKQSKGPRCYTCNKYGHKSPECKNKTKDTQKASNSYAAVFVASTTQDDAWYVDSGASSHMTKHRGLLSNENDTPSVKTIRTADNKILNVQCSGQVSLNVCNKKGQENKLLFRNVLCVPELATNLISVSQIVRSGGQVRFNQNGCAIINRGQIVATASIINNMYRLNMPGRGYACMSDVDAEDIYLWHQRMGHLNFNSLKKMSDNVDHVIFSEKSENLSCITCKEGKQTRLPFKSECKRAQTPLQLVHSDICGPMETQTLGGSKYFITFLDDYSKKIYVYFLRNKSDALEKFKEFRNEVENQLEARIKVLRTDNGLEYVNNNFSDYLKSCGIIHQTTTPYTPEQMGLRNE